MVYGIQYQSWHETSESAQATADGFKTLEGCIRTGIRFSPFDWSDIGGDPEPWKAYAVFALDCPEGLIPDGCRRVFLAGNDLIRAQSAGYLPRHIGPSTTLVEVTRHES